MSKYYVSFRNRDGYTGIVVRFKDKLPTEHEICDVIEKYGVIVSMQRLKERNNRHAT